MEAMESLRRAAEAAGIDVEEMQHDAALPDVVPPDEAEAERQAAAAQKKAERGAVCLTCGEPIKHADRNVLREVTGFYRSRDEGGQNHVIARQETGRIMCGDCGLRLRSGLAPEQERLL